MGVPAAGLTAPAEVAAAPLVVAGAGVWPPDDAGAVLPPPPPQAASTEAEAVPASAVRKLRREKAMGVLLSAFDCASGPARDDPALAEEVQQERRDGHDRRRGHHLAPRGGVAVEIAQEPNRRRHAGRSQDLEEGIQKLVPRKGERAHGDDNQRRSR